MEEEEEEEAEVVWRRERRRERRRIHGDGLLKGGFSQCGTVRDKQSFQGLIVPFVSHNKLKRKKSGGGVESVTSAPHNVHVHQRVARKSGEKFKKKKKNLHSL